MSAHAPTDAEKAMAANAKSRERQGAESDQGARKAADARRKAKPAPSTKLTGPGGDPVEGKR
jgi:hypothetical protein